MEVGDRRDEVEGHADGPLGVVLGGGGRSPDRHHRVADELLDGAAVARDQRPRELEVARQELADVLGVAAFGKSGEADEIGEEHGHQAPLGDGRCGSRRCLFTRDEGRAALAAEPLPGRVGAAAGGAGHRERRPAVAAELLAGRILGPAIRARRHAQSLVRGA